MVNGTDVSEGAPTRRSEPVSSPHEGQCPALALQETTLPKDIPAEADERRETLADRDISLAEEFPFLAEIVSNLQETGFDHTKEFE